VAEARQWLSLGGHLLLEIGGAQPDALLPALEEAQFGAIGVIRDAEGDVRGIEAMAV
jgi:hypothetical protein